MLYICILKLKYMIKVLIEKYRTDKFEFFMGLLIVFGVIQLFYITSILGSILYN